MLGVVVIIYGLLIRNGFRIMKNCLSQNSLITYTSNQNFISPVPASIRQKSKKRSDLAFSSLVNSPNPRFNTPKLGKIPKCPNLSVLSTIKEPRALNCSKTNLFNKSEKKIIKKGSLQLVGKTFMNKQKRFLISPIVKTTQPKTLKLKKIIDFSKLEKEKKLFIRNLNQISTPILRQKDFKKPKITKPDHLQDLYTNSPGKTLTGWDY